ncbi:hypothetical protein QWZ13_01475 [Reinekea marina]|uniref:hypothetical protein n=1 Tax=Reinekea marina TaxID=1310421 RepID=UPI0025B43726|nr:hypothetical protein [Reinekea marina]MDN3647574.1 hypothetical protein [Reinekea marina]
MSPCIIFSALYAFFKFSNSCLIAKSPVIDFSFLMSLTLTALIFSINMLKYDI